MVSPDGKVLYAGATLSDGTKGIIRVNTAPAEFGTANEWALIAQTTYQPNGLAADWSTNTLYCTHEGLSTQDGGVFTVSVESGKTTVLADDVPGADGCWLDPASSYLYVGQLMSLNIWVYDVKNSQHIGLFEGASSLKKVVNMLDDITLHINGTDTTEVGKTLLYGADFTGNQIIMFSLDGSVLEVLQLDETLESLQTPTSVRYGKGPGFKSNTLYVTEGGGLFEKQRKRRVVEVSP